MKSKLGRDVHAALRSLRWNLYAWRSPDIQRGLQRMPIEDVIYSLNVSPRYKYVYMDNPKTGCSSLKSALVELELRGTPLARDEYDWTLYHGPPGSPLKRITQMPGTTPLRWLRDENYRFVTFVRNPYARLLSCYRDKILVVRRQKLKILQLLGYSGEDMQQPVSFAEFARAVAGQRDYEMDAHWRTQSAQLWWGIINYDFVGRFETYNEDFDALFEHLNIPKQERPALRHLHKSKEGRREGCRDYYTEEIQNLVYARYREDFENFGYGYELPE